MIYPAEVDVVGHEPLTSEDLKILARLKKKEMTHMGEVIRLSPKKE